MNKDRLKKELSNVKYDIKAKAKMRGDRAPMVCSDYAIDRMVELLPRKREDFLSIEGLGNAFVENYANDFLRVITKNIETPMEKTVSLDSKSESMLKELEKKLVDINRKNCLLYLPKLPAKRGMDLFSSGMRNPLGILFGNGSEDISCEYTLDDIPDEYDGEDFSAEEKRRISESISKFRKYTTLLREINKDIRDKGQNDLYIGYPFAKGRLSGENFDVRCPLALFPVEANKDAGIISIKLDASRDIIYNNALVLAFNKFNNVDKELPNDIIEDISEDKFIDTLLEFYASNGIRIKNSDDLMVKFVEYSAETFPKYENGELYVEHCAVLGKFPIRSSVIQKDFDEIIKLGTINELLNTLLQNVDDLDYYDDSYAGEEEEKDNDKPLDISENDIVYINDLNSSQEAVLSLIDHKDSLVVQGPPGTGKSQVITSLIVNSVNRGKTVLMVSEKKTALDVVYSRLGDLSTFALLIDDVGNKDLFYNQLARLLRVGFVANDYDIDLDAISKDVDKNVKRLESIANVLFAVSEFGIEPYKIYQHAKRVNINNTDERNKAITIKSVASEEIYSKKFEELSRTHKRFSNEDLDARLLRYIETVTQFPWMLWFKEGLTEFDIITFERKIDECARIYNEWKNKWFIPKILGKKELNEHFRNTIQEFFDNNLKDIKALLISKTEDVKASIFCYPEFRQCAALYASLNDFEKLYFDSMLECSRSFNESLRDANEDLYNNVLYNYIVKFEADNRELFLDIKDFDRIIDELKAEINQKKELTKKKVYRILLEDAGLLHSTKHSGEISRAVESKRRMSVNKFIKTFGFELFKSVKIWLLTPEVVSEILPLEKGMFDLVVFDEASQMYVEKGIPSILRAKKVVVAGDHKQLRPSKLGVGRTDISEDLPEDKELPAILEEESLLDLARFKYQDVMLNFHYRSKYEELIAFSNYAFYHARLYVSPNMDIPASPPIEFHKLDNGIWSDRANIEEAKKVIELLREFFKNRRNEETIGIITFNVSQRDLIDDLIDEECIKDSEFATEIRNEIARTRDGEDIGLFVKNIESVQGDERDVIIFSIGYAKNETGRIVRQWGWLNQKGGENRLNVAISRARLKVHIVTSILPEELQVEDAKNDGPKYLKKYLQYAFCISNHDNEGAHDVLISFGDEPNPGNYISFDSIFEEQVYNALTEKGYDIDTQVGIGGYSIDLAVKKNDKYVLGIECDGRLYHSSKSARERDVHRQKYLESRGWRIHRIWSTNWWKNPTGEIDKICIIVDSL